MRVTDTVIASPSMELTATGQKSERASMACETCRKRKRKVSAPLSYIVAVFCADVSDASPTCSVTDAFHAYGAPRIMLNVCLLQKDTEST